MGDGAVNDDQQTPEFNIFNILSRRHLLTSQSTDSVSSCGHRFLHVNDYNYEQTSHTSRDTPLLAKQLLIHGGTTQRKPPKIPSD